MLGDLGEDGGHRDQVVMEGQEAMLLTRREARGEARFRACQGHSSDEPRSTMTFLMAGRGEPMSAKPLWHNVFIKCQTMHVKSLEKQCVSLLLLEVSEFNLILLHLRVPVDMSIG